ncbi:MAG TPA: bifunctional [glutamine synthetase] adenylyltransferase/[glutamine synthetase]-adenylyl-L-tyrosine phosphorylase [Acidimicrobiia bacterium]
MASRQGYGPEPFRSAEARRTARHSNAVNELDVLHEPAVVAAIDASADAAGARAGLTRILEANPSYASLLRDDPVARAGLVAVTCASRSLTSALVNDPELLDVFPDSALEVEHAVADARHNLARWRAEDDDAERALRRGKRAELLRIAVRDLLGFADMPAVGRELAALAQACLESAVAIVDPGVPLAVIGMGKLGGAELNYASDVDVLFVHDGDAEQADRAARALLSTMSAPTSDGIVFRTDADLRPEGRAGALSRNLESYAAWYERWAQHWEFQALLKAHPVAGDAVLGTRFLELVAPFVWPDRLDPDAIREVRAMKGRAEAELQRRGLTERELKRGRGGIRDVEFAVQLLQLVHGRHDETVRSRSTLVALAELAAAGYVEAADEPPLAAAYRFLRTVEHRLQLWDEQQTHTVPADGPALVRVARVLGYRDTARAGAVDLFLRERLQHQTTVRTIHERLFFAPILETLAGAGPLPVEAAEERLAAFGFVDTAQTRAALRELTHGLTRRSRVMQQLLPVILDWISATPDPDLGLLQLRRLAEGPTRSAALATTFREKPGAAERICRILGTSRVVGDALLRQPEVVELIGDDAWLVGQRSRDELREAALETLGWRADRSARRAGLRRFKRRELLRIGARDVLGLAPVEVTARELADLAEASIEAALASLLLEHEDTPPFAVIGLGRLGGEELSYASDVDVLFVYDGRTPSDFAHAERTATALLAEIGATTAEGQTFEIDARLRPEGSNGPLARSLDGYRTYYERWVQPWELQALLRARLVAGDRAVGEMFLSLIEPFVYRDPFPAEDAREIRRIKARVERERIPAGDDPEFHLKLGRGGLTDVEFTVQLLQLMHGARHSEIREPSTTAAIDELVTAGALDRDDGDVLRAAYVFCERARNAGYLVTGRVADALPGGVEGRRVAQLLGYLHRPEAELRDDYRRLTRRARRVVERVFYEA